MVTLVVPFPDRGGGAPAQLLAEGHQVSLTPTVHGQPGAVSNSEASDKLIFWPSSLMQNNSLIEHIALRTDRTGTKIRRSITSISGLFFIFCFSGSIMVVGNC